MYEDFYKLRERPFAVTRDRGYFYANRAHAETAAALRDGIDSRARVIIVTGEIGSGKTTLLRGVLDDADRQTSVAWLEHTVLNGCSLTDAIEATLLDTEPEPAGDGGGLDQLRELARDLAGILVEEHRAGRRPLLAIDEAENISLTALDRLLASLDAAQSPPLQVVLVGQTPLRDALQATDLQRLNARVDVSCQLPGLDTAEAAAYINHRLRYAATWLPLQFPADVCELIHRQSEGLPARINMLCDTVLMCAWRLGRKTIELDVAKSALGVELDEFLSEPPAGELPALSTEAMLEAESGFWPEPHSEEPEESHPVLTSKPDRAFAPPPGPAFVTPSAPVFSSAPESVFPPAHLAEPRPLAPVEPQVIVHRDPFTVYRQARRSLQMKRAGAAAALLVVVAGGFWLNLRDPFPAAGSGSDNSPASPALSQQQPIAQLDTTALEPAVENQAASSAAPGETTIPAAIPLSGGSKSDDSNSGVTAKADPPPPAPAPRALARDAATAAKLAGAAAPASALPGLPALPLSVVSASSSPTPLLAAPRRTAIDEAPTADTPPPAPGVPDLAANSTPAAPNVSSTPGGTARVPASSAANASAALAPGSPAPAPAGAAAASPSAAEALVTADERSIRTVVNLYRVAFSSLDVGGAKAVWPSVDARALGRAFGQLQSQSLRFDRCQVAVVGVRAIASCDGSAQFVPKVGEKTTHDQSRTWTFDLRKSGQRWAIEKVEAR